MRVSGLEIIAAPSQPGSDVIIAEAGQCIVYAFVAEAEVDRSLANAARKIEIDADDVLRRRCQRVARIGSTAAVQFAASEQYMK